MNNETIKVVHASPGRVRLKMSKMKQNSALEAEVRNRLSTAKAIQRVEVNTITGSVLLLYNPEEITRHGSLFSLSESFRSIFPEINFEELKSCLISPSSPGTSASLTGASVNSTSASANSAPVNSTRAPANSATANLTSADHMTIKISEFSRTVNERLKKAGSPDLKVLLPISLLALGIRGLLVAENVPFPAWYDFLWFSFSTFFILNPVRSQTH
jgi:hypothetical protein